MKTSQKLTFEAFNRYINYDNSFNTESFLNMVEIYCRHDQELHNVILSPSHKQRYKSTYAICRVINIDISMLDEKYDDYVCTYKQIKNFCIKHGIDITELEQKVWEVIERELNND